MKKRIGTIVAISVAAFFVFAGFSAGIDGDCVTWSIWGEGDIIAGQDTPVGTVEIWNDGCDLYVEFTTTGGWYVTEVHIGVGDDLSDLTNKAGAPQKSKWYKEEYGTPMLTDEISLDICEYLDEELVFSDCLYVAVHFVVEKYCGQTLVDRQTGWGDGPHHFEKTWGMYWAFKIVPLPCDKQFGIYDIAHSGGQLYVDDDDGCYWKVTPHNGFDFDGFDHLETPPPGGETWFYGWCIETGETIGTSVHNFQLFSTYNPNLPDGHSIHDIDTTIDDVDYYDDFVWDNINWIINNKDDYTATQIQHVIWFIMGCYSGTLTEAEEGLLIDSIIEGDGFFPDCGQNLAVMLFYSEGNQDIIIEVDP